ncbi:hypothetical protein Fmac_027273 [Flemingia macrophylla]|uniref:Plant bHLH transcription factor ACT-like domain-containing protein n=1 Tax=Flemingia macrophylla TaxID=520843 RepID=A0ABD1LH88_9FABA
MKSMEESCTSWLCDAEPDDYSFIGQSDTKVGDVNGSLASHHDIAAALEDNPPSSFSTERRSSVAKSDSERPFKLLKIEQLPQKTTSSPCSYIISFENTNPPPFNVESVSKPGTKVFTNRGNALPSKSEPRRVTMGNKQMGSLARTSHHTRDHIIAEKIRREDWPTIHSPLNPHSRLKKVKVLEEQTKRKNEESVVLVKRSQDEDVSDSSSNSFEFGNDPSKTNLSLLREVEARVSKKNVLIQILCEKEKVVLVNIFREIEKLHLSVINNSSLSFNSTVLDTTVVDEMEDEINYMSGKELARNLRVGLMQFE